MFVAKKTAFARCLSLRESRAQRDRLGRKSIIHAFNHDRRRKLFTIFIHVGR